jgi:hypothetical protein
MKTRDEMVYDFMLALAGCLNPQDLDLAIGEEGDLDEVDGVAVSVLRMAQALTHHYLESL